MKCIEILIFSLTISTSLISQKAMFEWADSSFEIGSKRIVELKFAFDGPCTTRPCYDFADNALIIDTLIFFLQRNPTIEIEIGYHSDQRGTEEYNKRLSEILAKGIKEELKMHGIEQERMTYKGYGESMPIILEEEINKIKSIAEKEAMHKMNKRIEIIII